ncbi:MAG: hypothetical protein HY724_13500 [Candidatus Rokubacteria bacterium]|nr:hypothetical protein [Candidatus Rokubacteria bacterium]
MALTVTYKGYTIRGKALPVLESGEWLAEALVTFPHAAGSRAQRVPDLDDRSFITREDAEGYAVNLAMRWVDQQG